MSNIDFPEKGDFGSSGREVAWRDEEDQFDIVTWNGLNREKNFDGFYSRWWVDRKRGTIVLLEADVRTRADDKWWSKLSGIHHKVLDHADNLPDSHFREARKVGREVFGKKRFESKNLNCYPDETDLPDYIEEEE